jgi:hypothetical protein
VAEANREAHGVRNTEKGRNSNFLAIILDSGYNTATHIPANTQTSNHPCVAEKFFPHALSWNLLPRFVI